ncbi:hypothetical protein FPV67DRAFT_1775805 [Lyophyllum atratum]|nr:hypothetical protein FPV67DRAFT_1775805 [Lyophyllum atratum]
MSSTSASTTLTTATSSAPSTSANISATSTSTSTTTPSPTFSSMSTSSSSASTGTSSSSTSSSSSSMSTSTSSSTSSSSSSSSSSSPSSSPTSSSTSSTSSSSSSSTSSRTSNSPSNPPTSTRPPPPPSTSTSPPTSLTPPPGASTPTSGPPSDTSRGSPTTFVATSGLTAVASQSVVTSIITSTASDGRVVTITAPSGNQTLSPDNNNSKISPFFRNTGAVAGVFAVVGLAAASILLWILFAVRRRRRTRRLEHDTAVSATLAAAGFHRTPLDDDDVNMDSSRRSRFGSPDVEMNQRSSSGFASSAPSGTRTSAYVDSPHPDDADPFNPYHDYVVPPNPAVASGSNPPPGAFVTGPYRDHNASGSAAGDHVISHSASHSAGSYEPLLASYYRPAPSSPVLTPTRPPSPPPRNPQRVSDAGRAVPIVVLPPRVPVPKPDERNLASRASSVYSADSIGDDRLDPGLRQRMNVEADRASERDLKDEEDYSRPVLGVRNLPDTTSQVSQEM